MNKVDRNQLKRAGANEPFFLFEIPGDILKGDVKPWMNGLLYALTPYFTFTFSLLPLGWGALFYALVGNGYEVFLNAFINVVIAELMTNVHSFLMIVPNHAGDDLKQG